MRSYMIQELVSHSEEETKQIAGRFADTISSGSVVTLRGDLGVGKTAFSAGILEALGAQGPFQSPTFVIMHRYDLPNPSPQGIRRVYHIDAYRINDPEHLARLGFEEWTSDPEGLVLVEWPERVESLLPTNIVTVSLETESETERRIAWNE